jgi:L-malate glycosyltransferase
MPGNERPRLLFINHWAARLGGAEHSLLDILAEAVHRADVTLVTAEGGLLADRAAALGAAVRIVPCSPSLLTVRRGGLIAASLRNWRGLFSYVRYILRLRRMVAAVRPHVIHANVPKSHVALMLLARLGFPGRACFHMREIFPPRSIPYRLYAALFPRRKGCVIAISEAVRASLPPRLRKVAQVVYNGVSLPAPFAGRPRPAGSLRFVYLGRVVPWKGCLLLVEAFARVYARRGEKAGTLDIIGDTLYWSDSYREELAAAIERSVCRGAIRLRSHTETPLDDLSRYDVFCLASDREPFGRVVAEAQGCGLPVVAFANGGVPEVVEQGITGTLVPYGDVEAFACAMETFIDHPDLVATMGKAARERTERLFNREIQMKKIVALLEKEACGEPISPRT